VVSYKIKRKQHTNSSWENLDGFLLLFFFQLVLLRHVILNFHFVSSSVTFNQEKHETYLYNNTTQECFYLLSNKNLWQLAQFIDSIYRNNPTLVFKWTAFQNAFIQELFICIFF